MAGRGTTLGDRICQSPLAEEMDPNTACDVTLPVLAKVRVPLAKAAKPPAPTTSGVPVLSKKIVVVVIRSLKTQVPVVLVSKLVMENEKLSRLDWEID